MKVLVAGSHGTTGRHIVEKLTARGHQVKAMIRDDEQADTLRALGGDPVVADLTEDVAHAVDGCEAVVFAAGSKGKNLEAVDKQGAIKLIDASLAHGAGRFLMLSSMGADDPSSGPDDLQDYLAAKHAADDYLRHTTLAYTIFQPGALTDDPAQGTIALTEDTGTLEGSIPRADVAEAMAAALDMPATHGCTIEFVSGDVPVPQALASL